MYTYSMGGNQRLTLPVYKFCYFGILKDRDGKLLFKRYWLLFNLGTCQVAREGGFFSETKFRPAKFPFESIQRTLSAKFVGEEIGSIKKGKFHPCLDKFVSP